MPRRAPERGGQESINNEREIKRDTHEQIKDCIEVR